MSTSAAIILDINSKSRMLIFLFYYKKLCQLRDKMMNKPPNLADSYDVEDVVDQYFRTGWIENTTYLSCKL